jgi:type IV pilus assembly protein PilV
MNRFGELAMPQSARKSAGFSLIEAMVSLIVISVGMIGIAAMYGQGLGASRTALSRSVAVNLAMTMADNIGANRLGQAAYAGAPANNSCDAAAGGGVDCTPAQMAAHDLWRWQQDVVAQLGATAVGAVAYAAGPPGTPPTYTITVTWDEPGVGQVTETMITQDPAF